MASAVNENTNKDKRKFWLATFLCVSGVGLLFTGIFVPGTSTGYVLGGAGETFMLAGAILGVDAYFSTKITKIVKDVTESEMEKK